MTEKELKIAYNRICEHTASRRLKPAFDSLEKLIMDNSLGNLIDDHRELEQTYHYMLKYTVEGTQDPERQKVYRKLVVSVFDLADRVYEALRMKYSGTLVYDKKRSAKSHEGVNYEAYLAELESYLDHSEADPGKAEELKEHQQKITELFYQVWFKNGLSTDEFLFLQSFFLSNMIMKSYKLLMVTAVTLSLQRYFDREKFSLLYDLYDSEDPAVSQYALVGLLLNLYRYDSRMPFYPSITGRLKILNESPEFKRNLEKVIVQLIRSKETEKIQRKIRDEIIPEMIKISPNLKDKINLDSLMDQGLGDDKNPEWEDIFKDSPGLMDKMEEFSELQMEGADVFMGSFSMLKIFPFFNELVNWFMPFFPENPEIKGLVDSSDKTSLSFIKTIGSAPILCNSDKYSFCFSLQNLPSQNREFMAQGMKAEMEQFKELEKDEELIAPDREREFISNRYIQDLYRFYKLHPRKSDFEDVFDWRFDFHNKQVLGEMLREDQGTLRNIAEYYFAKSHYDEAAEIYSYLLSAEKNAELYQKLAFCHQKLGDFERALEEYKKAELYELNRIWNLKKIALCYRILKQPEKALEYYREVEKLDPDNLTNQVNIAHSLLELNQFDEALKGFFKVEYLSLGNEKVWRPIGWCSFVTGKKDQAEKYFSKLIENNPNKHDLMNMGHVQWSLGNRKAALDYYKKSISGTGFSEIEFLRIFEEDLPHLLEQDVDQNDVPIMLDQLRYFVEE